MLEEKEKTYVCQRAGRLSQVNDTVQHQPVTRALVLQHLQERGRRGKTKVEQNIEKNQKLEFGCPVPAPHTLSSASLRFSSSSDRALYSSSMACADN